MPKIVDAAERRQHIADAVLRLVAARGVSAASLRNVAAEAGLNVGSVRHYFTDHGELLAVAATVMAERVEARAAEHFARLTPGTPWDAALELLLDAICELLPLDEQRRAECLIFLAFAEHSRLVPEGGDLSEQLFRGPRELAKAAYENVGLPPQVRTAAEEALAAVIDGLTLYGVHRPDPQPPEFYRDVLRWQIRTTVRTGRQA
ncbi:TetR/AcrR family transcriptional regulator [Propionibacteriaceae bacterium Y1685]|uniref:TetR/AcrR family transcriptional regulator n=1 Tax=Microlunatus sp. Y1700 TaxID=3418487 RepID=UPI003B7D19D7